MGNGNNELIVRIGVLADTHIPDRAKELHPDIIPIFQQHKVDRIIHAGDICVPSVLEQLAKVAPVDAVRGNRDWWKLRHLPKEILINVNNVEIFVCHGHGKILNYLFDKVPNLLFGYKFERFQKNFSGISKDIDIVVFGHSHKSESKWIHGRYFFNPGSASDPGLDKTGPSIGLLEISSQGKISSRIVRLK